MLALQHESSQQAENDPLQGRHGDSWAGLTAELARLERRQLFFVGGAPRSGTTWLQQCLDRHPDVSCAGEGLFMAQLATPLRSMLAERARILSQKNRDLFVHTGGYALPTQDDTDLLLRTAILLSMRHQPGAGGSQAVGEKTPENVFFFPQLHRLFPDAKFIGIARDPRDALTSAWHFFQKRMAGPDENAAKFAFIRMAMPSMAAGARAMLEFAQTHAAQYRLVTYEKLKQDPALELGRLYGFLNVARHAALVQDVVAATTFSAQTRLLPAPGTARPSFFRKGIVGDWRSTFNEEMNALILRDLGWMFPHFGWQA